MKVVETEELPVYDSSLQRSMALSELLDAYKYRNAIFQLTRRDVVSRYKRSFLGIIWTMLNPLGMMLILAVVFSNIFNAGPTYAAYVLSGLIVWNFFSQTTNAIVNNLNAGMGLIRKIYVPQSVFGISAILTGLVNLLFALVPLFLVMLVTGVHFTWAILFTPISILLLALFALGIGMILATLGVFFPDVIEMYQIILIAWMYLTPVIYPIDILPETTRFLVTHFNPMFAFVQIFRVVTYDGRLPTLEEILPALVFSIFSIIIGWWFFSRKAGDFAYRV
jgi:ABC-2 type transport system permease protein